MQKINKKAVSEVISTVLIILVSVLGITVLSVFIYSQINSLQYSPRSSCLNLQVSKPIFLAGACFDSAKKEIQVNVARKLGTEVTSLDFSVKSSEGSANWCCGEECTNCLIPEDGKTKTYFLEGNSEDKEISLLIDSCVIDTIKITNC